MSPVNRFMQDTSTFINAIKNGEWVLIDGIESAPPTVAEKLSSLCGENPNSLIESKLNGNDSPKNYFLNMVLYYQ